ncbi:ABC-three component system middle component 6 [Pseudarthrobacter siccitolerans]
MSQLLPDKFVPLRQSLVGQGAVILGVLRDERTTVAELYVESKARLAGLTYDGFVLTLDWLYLTDSIFVKGNKVGMGSA